MCRFQQLHHDFGQKIVTYLQKYPFFGLWFLQRKENSLQDFLDTNYRRDLDGRVSTNAYMFTGNSTYTLLCLRNK